MTPRTTRGSWRLEAGPSSEFRRELARKAFAHTASYDAAIAEWLAGEKFPEEKFLVLKREASLRYGENPHQEASLYRVLGERGPLLEARVLQGKAMSFNNYLDAEAAWNLVSEFAEPSCVAVKHQNPCGVALGKTPLDATRRPTRPIPFPYSAASWLLTARWTVPRRRPWRGFSWRWSWPLPSAQRPGRSYPARRTFGF